MQNTDAVSQQPKFDPQNLPSKNLGLAVFNHFGVAVRSIERSVAFYSAMTGKSPAGRGKWSSTPLGVAAGTGENTAITWATFQCANLNIDLLQVDEPKAEAAEYGIGQPGAMHICWEVDDLSAVFERMEAIGISFKGAWHRISKEVDGAEIGEGVVVAYFDGPDGEHLELIQPAGPFLRK